MKDISLALGVINSIMVCDRRDDIIFAGDAIQDALFRKRRAFSPHLLDNFADPHVQTGLKAKLDEVREKIRTCVYEFELLGETVFILPANYGSPENILLALREQVLLANQVETDLRERVKEAESLYSISGVLEIFQNRDMAMDMIIRHLRRGFQFPDIIGVQIILDGKSYGDDGSAGTHGTETNYSISEEIVIDSVPRGVISVFYHEPKQILREERKLVKEVALMTARAIEQEEIRKNMEEQQKLLVVRNAELTMAAERLSASNNKLNALFNAITDTIVVIDTDFNISMSNQGSQESGGKCYQRLFKEDSPCSDCPGVMAFRSGRSSSQERRAGDDYFMLQSFPIRDSEGHIRKVIEICRNITKEKQMEQQLIRSYKLASLGKLTAGVAHEINNPNTFIRGNINIIDEAMKDILPVLDHEFSRNPDLKIARLGYQVFRDNIPILVEDMLAGANRIKKIVDGLRNFARKDEGLLNDDIDINQAVSGAIRFIEKEIRRNARLKVIPGESLPMFRGNTPKLEQVLMNLLLNASQAIEHNDGLITVETAFDQKNNCILIFIEDNGKGIDPMVCGHIFDPFFTTKRHKGGTGLGLSISYGIVHEHGGRISVESEMGKRTRFTIALPVVLPESK